MVVVVKLVLCVVSVFTPVNKTSAMGTSSTSTSLKRVMSLGRLSRRWNKPRTQAAAAAAAGGCDTDVDDKAAVIPRSDIYQHYKQQVALFSSTR